ncbi:MAG: PAS domain-containing protein, partial [Treponema sp.]|nr:PAS domain-containing protein [Treponema sp.]
MKKNNIFNETFKTLDNINSLSRSEMEQEITKAHKFYQAILKSAPVGLTIFNEKIQIIDCNDEILKMCGTTKQDYIANFYNYSPEYQPNGEKSVDFALKSMKHVIKNNETMNLEWLHIDINGKPVPCELTVTSMEENGEFIGLAFAYDLRKIRKMEAEITKAARINQAILDNLPIGMAYFDGTPKVTGVNDKLAEMFGATKQHLIEHYYEDFSPEFLPDGRNALEEAYKVTNRAIAGEIVRTEWPHQTLAGEPVPCDLTLMRVKDEDDFVGIGFLYDLREIKKLTEHLHEQDELLKALNIVSSTLLEPGPSFDIILNKAMGIIANAVNIDRVCVWKNYSDSEGLFCSLIYEWSTGGFRTRSEHGTLAEDQRYDLQMIWKDDLSKGSSINAIVDQMRVSGLKDHLISRNIFSLFIMPVFIKNQFWGFVAFDNCHEKHLFSENEELILRSASRVIVNAISRNTITVRLENAVKEANEANRLKNIAFNSLENILNNIDAFVYITVPGTGELLFVNRYMRKALGRENDNMVGEYCYKLMQGFDGICDFCPCFQLDKNPDQIIMWDNYVEVLNAHIRHSDCYIDWPTGEKVHLQHAVDITEL